MYLKGFIDSINLFLNVDFYFIYSCIDNKVLMNFLSKKSEKTIDHSFIRNIELLLVMP